MYQMTESPNTRSRAAILEAGFAAFAADPSASLADVAAAAGVGRATLHRHFSGRDDLLRAMALQALEDLAQAVDTQTSGATSHTDALRMALAALVPLGPRNWFLGQDALWKDPEVFAVRQRQQAEMAALVDAAKAEGGFARDVPTDWILASFDALLFAAWEQVRDEVLTPRQASDLAWRTLTTGLNGV